MRINLRAAPLWTGIALAVLGLACGICRGAEDSPSPLIGRIDAAVYARNRRVLGFTDVEHYAIYRGHDETHPIATMTVKVTYRKGAGKTYEILSRSGSQIVQKFGLTPLLEDEKKINDPATVARSWFTSANYEMRVSPAEKRMVGPRTCTAVAIHPRRKAPNMIDGTLWVSPEDGEICEVDGIASQKPSIFAGTTQMMRQYRMIDGCAEATHARAESESRIFGRTVVTIEYGDYRLQTR